MLLTAAEKQLLDGAIAGAEKNTGAQIVAAIIPRSDAYAELPWIAFACGVLLGILAFVGLDVFYPVWEPYIAYSIVAVLGCGIASSVACIYIPSIARCFLSSNRSELETRQFAKTVFVDREIFSTRDRCGVLLLASVFERQVVVLPDKGFAQRVPRDSWQRVIDAMRTPLREAQYAIAIGLGIKAIESILFENGFHASANTTNELPDAIVDIEGTQP